VNLHWNTYFLEFCGANEYNGCGLPKNWLAVGRALPMSEAVQHSAVASHTGIDSLMVAATRFILAISALLIIFIDPTEPDRLVYETYTVLLLYTLYSLLVFLNVQLGWKLPRIIQQHSWWIDTAFYLVLISLSSGTNSIFFFFFFFAVLTAAFARGSFRGLHRNAQGAAGYPHLGAIDFHGGHRPGGPVWFRSA